jgi:hypothetical protein
MKPVRFDTVFKTFYIEYLSPTIGVWLSGKRQRNLKIGIEK